MRREEYDLPVGEIGMDTVTGSVTVGPGKMALGSNSWSPSRGIPGEFEHDLGNTDGMSPWTLSLSVVGASGVGHVRLIRLVEILTVPTSGEEGLDSDTVRAWDVKVEVVLLDTSGEEIGIDVTSEERDTARDLVHWATGEHPQSLGERSDGLNGRVPSQEVVESMESREGDERSIIVQPVHLGHPVVGLVGSDGSGST
jgi:hypothetical protein